MSVPGHGGTYRAAPAASALAPAADMKQNRPASVPTGRRRATVSLVRVQRARGEDSYSAALQKGAGPGLLDRSVASVRSDAVKFHGGLARPATEAHHPADEAIASGLWQAGSVVDDHSPKTSLELSRLLANLRPMKGEMTAPAPAHLQDRIAHVESLLRSSCFNASVTLEGEALQWEAAAAVLGAKVIQLRESQGGKPGLELLQLKRQYNQCIEKARAFRDQAEAADPLTIHRDDKQSSARFKASKSGKGEGNQQKAAIRFLESALEKAAPALRASGLGGGLEPKHLFKAALNEILSGRPNPVVLNRLCLPVPYAMTSGTGATGDAKSSPARMVECVQTPARELSDSMQSSYTRDGLKGVLCHDDTEHRHASNLYLSELRDDKQGPLLRLARHGAVSVFGLTPQGIKAISDERLGRVVLDLGYHPDGSVVPGAQPDAKKLAELGHDFRRRAESRGGEDLLAQMRATASRNRAREVADAALLTLPPQELVRIRGEIAKGRTPTVRLASVSLLTPDSLRGQGPLRGKYASNERLMWIDQREAWKAVERSIEGVPCRSLQVPDQENPPRIKFEIAAFDVPVNEGGVGEYSGLMPVSGLDLLEPTNQAAVERLLGTFPEVQQLGGWIPGGWVGEAIEKMPLDDPNRRPALTLARQVAWLMVTGLHLHRADDPYILVRRLLVLSQLTGCIAPAVNCRSGKDRTSEAEAQARQLAFHIATTGKAPALDRLGKEVLDKPQADLRSRQLWTLHQGGGSRQIQAWNTTYPGTKLKMEGLVQQYQMQDPALFNEYIGQSEAAKE